MIGNLCAVFLLSEKAGRDKCPVDGVNHAWCSTSNPKGLFLFKLRVEERSLKSLRTLSYDLVGGRRRLKKHGRNIRNPF